MDENLATQQCSPTRKLWINSGKFRRWADNGVRSATKLADLCSATRNSVSQVVPPSRRWGEACESGRAGQDRSGHPSPEVRSGHPSPEVRTAISYHRSGSPSWGLDCEKTGHPSHLDTHWGIGARRDIHLIWTPIAVDGVTGASSRDRRGFGDLGRPSSADAAASERTRAGRSATPRGGNVARPEAAYAATRATGGGSQCPNDATPKRTDRPRERRLLPPL